MTRLEIDAGNTRIKWRLVATGESGWWLTSLTEFVAPKEWPAGVSQVWVGSVAGDEVNAKLRALSVQVFGIEPLFAQTMAKQAGVVNAYHMPKTMGVDRWLVILAAYKRYGAATVVIDAGSAITVDFTSASGTHKGGYILPGRRLLLESLNQNTASVRVSQAEDKTSAPGFDTQGCVSGGVNLLMEGVVARIFHQVDKALHKYHFVVTGGDAEWFADYIEHVARERNLAVAYELIEDLVLDGLSVALES